MSKIFDFLIVGIVAFFLWLGIEIVDGLVDSYKQDAIRQKQVVCVVIYAPDGPESFEHARFVRAGLHWVNLTDKDGREHTFSGNYSITRYGVTP